MGSSTPDILSELGGVSDSLVLYALRNSAQLELDFTKRMLDFDNPVNQDYFLELYFRNLRLADLDTIAALEDVTGDERDCILSYFRDGVANFKFRDKIMESYKQLFPTEEQVNHHLEEMQAVLVALEARISELE